MRSVTSCITLSYTHSHLAGAQNQSLTIGHFTALQAEFWGEVQTFNMQVGVGLIHRPTYNNTFKATAVSVSTSKMGTGHIIELLNDDTV